MSKLATSNDETMQQIEWDRMIEDGLSEDECFEVLSTAGIDEITWSESLNRYYAQWQYFNLK